MNQCKYCQAELEENSTVCPKCGKDNAEPEAAPVETAVPEETAAPAQEPAAESAAPQEPAEPEKKSNTLKIALSAAALVLVLAVLIAAIVSGTSGKKTADNAAEAEETEAAVQATVPEDGNPDDETCKGTYTAEDEAVMAARDVVVARAGDKELTNAELQIYYWMEVRNFLSQYGAYAAYFGLDYQQPLDTQLCEIDENPETWQQFFLKSAINSWHNYQAMAAQAEAEGVALSEEYQQILDTVEPDLQESAVANGFASGDELLKQSLGASATMQDYKKFMELYYHGFSYYNTINESIQPSDEELEAYFDAKLESYAESGVTKESKTVDVRHILVYPEGADSTNVNAEEFSDEAWAAGEATAQAILEEWLAGEATEDTFAALANERSGDPGSNTNGGLYTDVREGEMVQTFNDWCFDAERQPGDYGVVKTNYGFHIMYFVGDHLIWKDQAKSDYINEKGSELVDAATAKYPLTVDYSAILLGVADLG